jgi:hypothetical protein
MDLPPLEYEGEKVRVGTYFPEELCRGEVAAMDAFVSEVEDDLRAWDDEKIEVYVVDLVPEELFPGSICEKHQTQGCADTVLSRVIGNFTNVDHELVHIVQARIGRPWSKFYTEGIAEALAEDRTFMTRRRPSENLDRVHPGLDAAGAGHFMRWWWETGDRAALRRLLSRRGRDPEKAFADEFGMSIRDAEERYFDEAPGSYPRRSPCAAPQLGSTAAGHWEETIEFDCGGPTTRGVAGRIREHRTMVVEAAGFYDVALSAGGWVGLMLCQTEPLPVAEEEADAELRDERHVRHESWTYPDGTYTYLEGGRSNQVFMDAGTYDVRVEHRDENEGPLVVQIRPSLLVEPEP